MINPLQSAGKTIIEPSRKRGYPAFSSKSPGMEVITSLSLMLTILVFCIQVLKIHNNYNCRTKPLSLEMTGADRCGLCPVSKTPTKKGLKNQSVHLAERVH